MHDIPDSQLLRNEASVYRHTSQTLLKLAENLYAAGKCLDSKANNVERESECAEISEARRRWTSGRSTNSGYDQKTNERRDILELRSTASVMVAANTLKQEKIISSATESLVSADAVMRGESSNDGESSAQDVLSQLDPDQMPTFVYYLSTEMLTDPRLMEGSEKAEEAESSTSSKATAWKGPTNGHDHASSIESATPDVEEQRSLMPDVGFVTASGWVAINRRQHW